MLRTIFCICLWSVLFSVTSCYIVSVFTQGINHLKKLHQIPCAKCAYFTGDYRLKCPLNPTIALSEEAINCREFQATCSCNFNNFQNSKTNLIKEI